MRTVGNRQSAEDIEDLAAWVRGLEDCPPVTQTVFATCKNPAHADDPASWFYVEADAEAGVARLRCLSGAHATDLLDSAEQWTYPGVWSCRACGQSIAEVVYGIHDESGTATWLAMVARCVDCGDVAGLTDIVLPETPLDSLLEAL
jgi:hypothetical protein